MIPVPEINRELETKWVKSLPAIPDEFKRGNTKQNTLFNDWFFCGVSDLKLKARPGVDHEKAFKVIRHLMGSFELKHEEKEVIIAFFNQGVVSRRFHLQ